LAIPLDLITAVLSFLFTLLIFSYLIGDNPLFKIALYIFVGVSSGYIAAVAWWQVIWPRLIQPLMAAMISDGPLTEKVLVLVPLFGAVLILMKTSARFAGLGGIVMAFLAGVGAAVAIAGAVSGTLLPQVMAGINAFDLASASARNISLIEAIFNGGIVLLGTVFTLTYFHFGASIKADGSTRRLGLIEISAWVGRIFIGITLGTVFAGVYAAALTALIERIMSLINFLGNFL
jgi:hypothetical protein